MSRKWPRVPADRLVKLLERLGYARIHQRGSHVKMRKLIGEDVHTIIVVVHKGRDAPLGHVRDVLTDAAKRNQIPVEDLIRQL